MVGASSVLLNRSSERRGCLLFVYILIYVWLVVRKCNLGFRVMELPAYCGFGISFTNQTIID